MFVCSIETLNVLVVTGVQANVVQSQDEDTNARGYLERQLQVEVGFTSTQSTSLAACFRRPNVTGKLLVRMLQLCIHNFPQSMHVASVMSHCRAAHTWQ